MRYVFSGLVFLTFLVLYSSRGSQIIMEKIILGCFSLFRAKALMDDNVMKRYMTTSEEALHYVQYDQVKWYSKKLKKVEQFFIHEKESKKQTDLFRIFIPL